MASSWTWARGLFEEGGLFSFKVKCQVLRQETYLLWALHVFGCLCGTPSDSRVQFYVYFGCIRMVSGGSVEAGAATFAGLYLGIVCVFTLPKPINVAWM